MADTSGDELMGVASETTQGNNNVKELRHRTRLGMPAFIVSLGVSGFVTWGLYTVIVSQISTIEKAFGLTSAETGWLLTVWEIGYIACLSVSSYFTPKAHIPRAIGTVTIICGISGLVCTLPHFAVFEEEDVSINRTMKEQEANLCLSRITPITTTSLSTSSEPSTRLSKKTIAYALFNVALVLQGIGKGPCYPYSAQYVDDNSNKQNTGFYMSIIWSIAIVGLAVGYAIGSAVSKVYVTLKPTTLSNTDSRFIGAWWLGFMCLGVLTLLSAIPLFFFPRQLKTPAKEILQRQKQPYRTLSDLLKEVKAAGLTLWEILKTPVYTLTMVGMWFQILAFASYFGFEPKYVETQFAVPAWKANLILGVASILSYCIGSLIGGYITKRFKMSPFQSTLIVVVLLVLTNLSLIALMFIGCPTRDIYNPLDGSRSPQPLDCDCSQQQLLPICGEDGRNYFSPCHAGCANGTLTTFSDCSLIPRGTAKSGFCPTGCKMVWVYAVVRFIGNVIDAIASMPVFVICLRSPGEDKKAFALGLSAATTSLVSWLPGPVIGGKMVDSTCLIWKTASTSGKFCGHYDTVLQRYLLMGVQFGIRAFGLLFSIGAILAARNLPHWIDDDVKTPSEDGEGHGRKALMM